MLGVKISNFYLCTDGLRLKFKSMEKEVPRPIKKSLVHLNIQSANQDFPLSFECATGFVLQNRYD